MQIQFFSDGRVREVADSIEVLLGEEYKLPQAMKIYSSVFSKKIWHQSEKLMPLYFIS